ncbi:MAG: hypothetical protein HY735_35075 [Verrucomicrobia bacterium]|nr:hypothetical protein [Verrucomicrobiota bacterium]
MTSHFSYFEDNMSRLVELNRLEDQLADLRSGGEDASDAWALIESLRSNIPVGVLLHHDRLRARGKRSVGEVRHGVCMACHMGVAIGDLQVLRQRQQLQKCNNCGRYLRLSEEDEAEVTALVHKPGASKLKAKSSRRAA